MATEVSTTVPETLREGAFAVLDCLGFKGAWARSTDANAIMTFLKESKSHLDKSAIRKQIDVVFPGLIKTSVAFISDTVVIGIQAPQADQHLPPVARGYLALLAVTFCGEVINRFLSCPVPFTLRGCVAYGNF
jgi:hypothetical protein